MLKDSTLKIRQKFIMLFTLELILANKLLKEKRLAEEDEERRLRREIEVAKLKEKYLTKKEPITQQAIKSPLIKPAVILQEKREQISPSPINLPRQTIIERTPIIEKRIETTKTTIAPVQSGLADLGKIMPLINDFTVTYIECPGANAQLIIKKHNQRIVTEIRLNEEEINLVIKDFSEKARIPLIEGLLKARVGNHEISAINSKLAGSKFTIIRTNIPPFTQFMTPQFQNQNTNRNFNQPRTMPLTSINNPF